MSKLFLRSLVVLGLGLTVIGCGQKAPTPAPKSSESASPSTALTPTEGSDAAGGEGKANSIPSTVAVDPPVKSAKPLAADLPKVAVDSKSFPDAAFLGDDIVGLVVAHPRRITEWPVYKMAKAAGMLENLEQQIQGLNVKPESVERVTLVIDQTSVDSTAKSAGLEVATVEVDAPKTVVDTAELKNNLKQIGLSLHNYHDVYNAFPRADGDAEGKQTGLSWRVHVLPYFGEADLYEQFHLDEPWDSDHNKTLIEQMPVVFDSPGVKEAGKTSVHVFVGKGTPFDGEKGKSIATFTDGTSNTILAVLAGADTADVWTKPGGLKFDAAAPKKALGEITEKSFMVLLSDGSVEAFPSDIEDQTLANAIQLDDGNVVEIPHTNQFGPPPAIPTLILSLTTAADQAEIVTSLLFEAEEESHEGETLHKNETSAVWFSDEKTVVCGPIETVKKMIGRKKSGTPGKSSVLSQLQLGADVTMAFNLESQAALMQQAVQGNPMLGLVLQIKSLALQLNVTGKSGDKLLELVATATSEQMASTLSQLAQGGLAQGKGSLGQFPLPPTATDDEKAAFDIAQEIVDSANIKQAGDRIEFLVPVPEGYEKLPELLKPALEKAKAAAERTKKMNNLKQVGLGFYNFESTFGHFPGAGRRGEKDAANDKVGLSWRVHILPFVDGAALYQQFNLDEPWDSETNKALIEKMPDIFKTDGVTEPGKTSLHVFTGPGAPFAKDAAPGIRDFTDGTSNTILVVEAGPSTAEIWTKPGGLDFDPKNPIKALGDIAEESFRILLGDGSVRSVPKTIDPENLRRLIQSADGEPIEDF